MTANGLGKMSLELLRHVRLITEEQERAGAPMLVPPPHQDPDALAARLKETPRYRMAGLDALRANVKALAAKNLLNLAVEKHDPHAPADLGKRDPDARPPAPDAEAAFLRRRG